MLVQREPDQRRSSASAICRPATTAEITVDVFQTAEGGRSLDNEACVDPADVIEESNENNNCSTTTALSNGGTQKISPDLLVVKSVDPSGPVNAGQALTYTVTISNVGTAKAAGPVTLTDTLPSNVTFVNYTATNGWTCTFTAPNLVCHETPGSERRRRPRRRRLGDHHHQRHV